jgi:hypothetical protein
MSILRAGPWGNLVSPHEDVPAIIDEDTDIYPVNCAKGDWPNQPWAALVEKFVFGEEYAIKGLNDTVTINTDFGYIDFHFCYQATQAFDININWLITATGLYFSEIYWIYNTIEGTSDSYFNTPADSGTETVTLPASTFCKFSAGIGLGSSDIETIEMDLS